MGALRGNGRRGLPICRNEGIGIPCGWKEMTKRRRNISGRLHWVNEDISRRVRNMLAGDTCDLDKVNRELTSFVVSLH